MPLNGITVNGIIQFMGSIFLRYSTPGQPKHTQSTKVYVCYQSVNGIILSRYQSGPIKRRPLYLILQWKPLYGITLGQSLTDPIN
jgi:hypothetical protein